jgi:hypothetical protein
LGIATVMLVPTADQNHSRVDVRMCEADRVTVEDLRLVPDARGDQVREPRRRLQGAPHPRHRRHRPF